MGFQKLLALLLLVAQCVHGFYPMEYLDILRLSGRAGLDSEEYFSKDETSRHDTATSEDHLPAETRYGGDYSNSQSEYPRDYDSREDFETQTFSSLFEKPLPEENDALYSPPAMDRYHKREEYFGELSKKSISSFHRPRKASLHSPEDLMAGASDPNFNQPRSRPAGRSRRARLSDYDLYYPKRQYLEDSSPEYRSKPLPPSKPYDDYKIDDLPRYVDEPKRPLANPAYSSEAYTRAPFHESRSKQLPKPSRKTYPRSPISVKSNKRDLPPSSTYSRQKSKETSRSVASRPLKLERELPKNYPPRKFSDSQVRALYDDDDEDDFRGKPLVTTKSWTKEKRQPKHFSDENKHYLEGTGYGKPVREQFNEHVDDEEDFRGKPLVTTKSWTKEKRQPKHFSDENKHYLEGIGYGKPVREQFNENVDDEEDFRGKPLVTTKSWTKEKRQPKHFSDENKHYLAATGYGKPVREQFHEQGITGPHAYKFGYNTGDPENPMARYEEKGPDGLVKGSYSYVDPMGKLQVVHYESHPEHGFKTTYA